MGALVGGVCSLAACGVINPSHPNPHLSNTSLHFTSLHTQQAERPSLSLPCSCQARQILSLARSPFLLSEPTTIVAIIFIHTLHTIIAHLDRCVS
jgi:hypothetical protein